MYIFAEKELQLMNFLEEKILKVGEIRPGNILRIDSFLNHQIDIEVMARLRRSFSAVSLM
jgi:xanthine phosphoribosyltransferase